jgi:rRNA biogenesis protein RRP5
MFRSQGKLIFLSLAASIERNGDLAQAEELYEKALNRPQYRKSKKMWMAFLSFQLKHRSPSAAKAQLSRSLQALSSHKHIEVIRHYALSEFDIGSADRARVIFEELISTYPKRSDIWHVYVDKEIKLGNIVQARQLFDRMTTIKTSAKNMKNIFKKYLSFETNYGDEYSQEIVKQKAREYVQNLVA